MPIVPRREGSIDRSARRLRAATPPAGPGRGALRALLVVLAVALVAVVAYAALQSRAPGVPSGGDGGGGGVNGTGQAAPLFDLVDIDGNPVSLQALRGRVVVLDLFATWCGPCRTQMGELSQVFARYNSSEVVIISIDVDRGETQSEIRAFRSDYGAQWAFASDTDSVGSKYGADYIPTLAIVDRAGNLSHLSSGVERASDLIARINPLLDG